MKLPKLRFWKKETANPRLIYRCWMCSNRYEKPNEFLSHLHAHKSANLDAVGMEEKKEGGFGAKTANLALLNDR